MSAFTYEDGVKAGEKLLGTCATIQSLGEEFDSAEEDMAFCNGLDDTVFNCTMCGWWFEQPASSHPESGEWVCEECCPVEAAQ